MPEPRSHLAHLRAPASSSSARAGEESVHVDHPGEAEQHTSCPSRNATWRANPSVMSGSDLAVTLAPVWKSVSASRWAGSKIASSSEAHPPAITKSTDFGGCVRAEEPTRPTGISCRKLGRMVQMPGPGSLRNHPLHCRLRSGDGNLECAAASTGPGMQCHPAAASHSMHRPSAR
jgi:hypothetical protein